MTTAVHTHTSLRDHVGAPLDRPVTLAVVGAGARGAAYAELAAQWPERVRVVAVAEPRDAVREPFASRHGVPGENAVADWRELTARGRIADAVLIATLDADHLAPTAAFAEQGYDILLEKPIAPGEAESVAIGEAAARTGAMVAVCHVMRYTHYTRKVKELLPEIGEVVSVEHLEPIGAYHFAHSFVRGNWRRTDESSCTLLAKSCHDIDWLGHVIGRPVVRASSFGGLFHFRPENRPALATDRCLDCPLQDSCAYSATTLYRDGLRHGGTKRYFTRVMTAGTLTEEAVTEALAEGSYGRCVYACDNDAVDHQVVNLEYEGGATASFTMTAFTPLENRHTKIFGTRGQLTGDGRHIRVYDFRTERTTVVDTSLDGSSAAEGHAGGDENLIRSFVDALHQGRPELIRSGIGESVDSHRVVFAAEHARRTGTVVTL
ncbi:Gfo/Idh/MocA family protein [Streptomyces melanosporofaciens]|uniref:Oxidoreductase family, NAD-binding Rossmann fold n=1 Tax=Streptomyces melanosporofaciens TaxID=67327 RepID=A0A1H4IAS5_STRMJ|nr:Gfo/Idh/MocA family oxidoreductase [Streptomyces melanosporofaciens]SEB31015.1 Oxidoreductase family, NAD-binding Rossmann fold [Streptomyces melanosporofaciens]